MNQKKKLFLIVTFFFRELVIGASFKNIHHHTILYFLSIFINYLLHLDNILSVLYFPVK